MKTTNLEKKQIDLIKESIIVYKKCIECRSLFDSKNICFANIEEFVDDRGKSNLFHLKEMSHELFRNSNDASYKEKLYDMTVGYIFHEAMKLRENMYQLEYYRPQCDIALHTLTDQEKKTVHEIGLLVNKAEIRLKEGFKEIKILLNELVGQLKDLIVLYKNNYLLPRFIFKNERQLKNIYGKKGFENLLNMAYSDGKHLLILKAGQSYLESEYYDTARVLFKKVLRLDSQDISALFLYMYSSAYYFYFKNMFTRSLILAEKARDLKIDETIKNSYMDSLNRLISDVSKEIKKKRK
jgi:tetratricopeptide (TPR) repeat protein